MLDPNNMTIKALTRISALVMCLNGTLQAETWPNLRDGVLHIRQSNAAPTSFLVKWDDAWISESQEDHAFLIDPQGALLQKIELTAPNTPGKLIFELGAQGDYQFEVTGASFRNISVGTQAPTPMVFEPVKIHKSISLPRSGHVYFNAPANTPLSFNAKYHEGVTDFSIKAVNAETAFDLKLLPHTFHWQFDRLEIPISTEPTTYEVSWSGRGEVSFWLDGVANLFSLRPEDWFQPEQQAGTAQVEVINAIAGPSPSIGATLPLDDSPALIWPIIEKWQLSAANYYLSAASLNQKQNLDLEFIASYEKQFNIKPSNTILTIETSETATLTSPELHSLVTNFVARRHKQGLLKTSYFAFADEPNLSFPDYDSFEHYFAAMATAIKQHPDPEVSQTLIAAPQSSRFLQGPTRTQADRRKGIDWADKLLAKHGQSIDAISWHEWLVRDLIDTPRYRTAVEQAAALVDRHAVTNGNRQKLIIGQTNISNGASLSPYEQDTFFAALWWASVVIQSSLPGRLDQLIWFKATDDALNKKGLITGGDSRYDEKPVSAAMQFINNSMRPQVMKLENNNPELDLLMTLSSDRKKASVLGVNKSKRAYKLNLHLPFRTRNIAATTLTPLGMNALATAVTDTQNMLTSNIAGETIFSIQMDVIEEDASGTQQPGLTLGTVLEEPTELDAVPPTTP